MTGAKMVMKNGDIQFKSVMTGNLVYEIAFASIYFECISTMFTVNIYIEYTRGVVWFSRVFPS